MKKAFPNLSRPGRIGSMTLKNRMVVTAMGINMGSVDADGYVNERMIAYHERQASGGVGLIVMGVTAVSWPYGGNQVLPVAISDDKYIPGLEALADAVHKHGAKIVPQLHHGGLTSGEDAKRGRPVWAAAEPEPRELDMFSMMLPDEMKAFFDPESPPPPVQYHAMTQENIAKVVGEFTEAADRAKQAGMD
ncbi:MAG: hypothetical protein ACR2O5_09975, partial [Thiogranum sp.]